MNEFLVHTPPVAVPRIIKIIIDPNLAYKLKTMLERYAKQYCHRTDSALALHIAHKMWILFYKAELRSNSHRVNFTCLTGHWRDFCRKFVEDMLVVSPRDKDLQQILMSINQGQEVKSNVN